MHFNAADHHLRRCHKLHLFTISLNCLYYFPATTNLDTGLVQRTDAESHLVEVGLSVIGVVLVVLGVSSFFQIFLSGLFPAIGLRSAQREDEDSSLLSNFLSNLDNRYLVYFIKYR